MKPGYHLYRSVRVVLLQTVIARFNKLVTSAPGVPMEDQSCGPYYRMNKRPRGVVVVVVVGVGVVVVVVVGVGVIFVAVGVGYILWYFFNTRRLHFREKSR